ncbi:hypothetical protein [Asinibacterium sp. OR53]|uniref:hypothetical protein n=1 Tax=Asinibacterium sp. OR53 TaxID=925409 RepID=UPI000561D2FE|nr:hypothetical protein [Asinibacterium sp. OR53]
MTTMKERNEKEFKLEIGLRQGRKWNKDKIARMHKFIKDKSAERSQEQKRKNDLFANLYQTEENAENNSIRENIG